MAARLERVAHDHQRHGEQSEPGESIHGAKYARTGYSQRNTCGTAHNEHVGQDAGVVLQLVSPTDSLLYSAFVVAGGADAVSRVVTRRRMG